MPASLSASLPLFRRAEQWFDRAHSVLLGALPCRRGCHACCMGIFPVTIVDAVELHRGLNGLKPALRSDIERVAGEHVSALERSFPRLTESASLDAWTDAELDAAAQEFSDLPCPALGENGECRVYEHRPLTCRMMGLPIESEGMVHGACRIQTAVPVVRLPAILKEESDRLAEEEARQIRLLQQCLDRDLEEVFLPYAFLRDAVLHP
jgi:Fe-S-cluster containining protein